MAVLRVYSTCCNSFCRPVLKKWRIGKGVIAGSLVLLTTVLFLNTIVAQDLSAAGKKIYDYYCYQCHGYAGNGVTLAANYLDPPPRNFNATSPEELTREQMINTVSRGKPGTAMTAFGKTLSEDEIKSVVAYVRDAFMSGSDRDYRYHTEQNGWPNHERYQAAFPYVFGELSIDHYEKTLSNFERAGKQLFMSACISCHEPTASEGSNHWELTGVSYPLGNYVEDNEPPVFELHERAPVLIHATTQETQGEHLYQKHCAHCHAEDGTGRNWIGSFLTPHPPDFTDHMFKQRTNHQRLYNVISQGIAGTSMPAWKSVFTDDEINATIAYMKQVFGPFSDTQSPPPPSYRLTPKPSWVKNNAFD